MEEAKQRKENAQNASEERKNFMQQMDLNRRDNEKLSDLEQVHDFFKVDSELPLIFFR